MRLPAKGIVTRKGRDSRPPRCGNQKREARGAPASRARSAPPHGFAPANRYPSPFLTGNSSDDFYVRRAGDTASFMTVRPDGSIEWRNKEGKYHREDGPAREWPAQGAKAWYRNGKPHRDDGRAMARRRLAVAGGGLSPLGKSWYRHGKRHREEGPAVEHADGRKEWCRQGKELTAAEFAAIREKELAEIGDAFKTGLTSAMTVSRPRPVKNSSRDPKTR